MLRRFVSRIFLHHTYIHTRLRRTMSLSAMAARLSGKTILITGASSGIGRATAFEFSRTAPDIKLILTARRIDTLNEITAEIDKESSGKTKVLPVQFDVSKPAEVREFLGKLPEEWRGIDVLVNNAYYPRRRVLVCRS
jgi:3-hydroxy acid dehydrogenase/malonic semialdehyde reductase